MSARRCSTCNYYWPHTSEYARCPTCGERTDSLADTRPMSRDEAKRIAARAEFDRRYEHREAERLRRGEPTPEELGAAEAREIIRLESLIGGSG